MDVHDASTQERPRAKPLLAAVTIPLLAGLIVAALRTSGPLLRSIWSLNPD